MSTLAILTAAGSGNRLGRGVPKALVPLAGTPLVVHAARRLAWSGATDLLVVTAPATAVGDVRRALDDVGLPTVVVPGGATRQASVAAGLACAPEDADVVLVHDAARPLAPPKMIARLVATVREGHDAVVPGLVVTDTIKQVQAGGDTEPVAATLDRSVLRAIQTPQAFSRDLLQRAHQALSGRAGDESTAVTDDAGLVEALGVGVVVVAGDPLAAKITTEHDLRVAELTYQEQA